jgi:hypothetical protein
VKAAKSLKEQNRWQLWLTTAANAVALYAVCQSDAFAAQGFRALFDQASNLLPVGLAVVVTTVANGLLPSAVKDRLVFLRWRHALPGHRAFSRSAPSDPRIDMARLKRALGNKLPADPEQENRTWYRLYKEVETKPAVRQVHQDFLLMRDYAGMAVRACTGERPRFRGLPFGRSDAAAAL